MNVDDLLKIPMYKKMHRELLDDYALRSYDKQEAESKAISVRQIMVNGMNALGITIEKLTTEKFL